MSVVDAMSGRLEDDVHAFPVRVYYEDTDAAGIVYHSNYLKFAERARTEMMRVLGADHHRMQQEQGVAFVVSRAEMHCLVPARLDDLIEVRSAVTALTGATMALSQIVRRDAEDLVRMNVLLACINRAGRAVRIPQRVRDRLADWQQRRIPKAHTG